MTEYHSDLEIGPSTSSKELIDFTKRQVQNPFEFQETTVYNFSTHKIDEENLKKNIERKLERNLYMIPMQVLSAEIFIVSILPPEIKNAEILLYNKNEEEYYAYKNFRRELTDEKRKRIQKDNEEILTNHE